MSDFEKEYKKYSEDSTPDLWSRIEAGVDAYEQEQTASAPIADKKKINITKYIGIIAAAACLIITIPAIILNMGGPSKHSDSEAAEAAAEAPVETSEAPAAVEIMAEPEAPADTEEAMVEPADAEMPVVEKAMAESAAAAMEDTAEEAYKEAPTEAGKFPFRAMWEEEATTPSGEEIVIDEINSDSRIRFSFDAEVHGFRIINLNITDITEDGELVFTYSEAIDGLNFNSGDEATFVMSFLGDIPNYGVAYLDSHGDEHLLTISESGYDGSIILSEL